MARFEVPILLGLLVAAGPSWAQQSGPVPSGPSSSPVATETLPAASFATVAELNEPLAPGDLIRVTRYFSAWRLTCDNRLSNDRRVCAVEQTIDGSGFSVIWRIGLTTDHHPAISIDVSRNVDADKGIVMRVGKTSTTIPFDPCGTICRAVIPYSGFIADGIQHKEVVGFGVSIGGRAVAVPANLDGLSAALDASVTPPALMIRDGAAAVAGDARKDAGGKTANATTPARAARTAAQVAKSKPGPHPPSRKGAAVEAQPPS